MIYDKQKLLERFPFIAVVASTSNQNLPETIGIVLGSNKNTITILDISRITDAKKFSHFLNICQDWWWYSNRNIPVNLYYPNEIEEFMVHVKHYSSKSYAVITGHVASLDIVVATHRSNARNRTLRIID